MHPAISNRHFNQDCKWAIGVDVNLTIKLAVHVQKRQNSAKKLEYFSDNVSIVYY